MSVGLTFFTPALPDDLDVLSRPLTYLEWKVASTDGADHDVAIYFDAGSDLVVNTHDQPVLDRTLPTGRSSRCCAWGRANSPCWRNAATICASIGAICTWRRTSPDGSSAFAGATSALGRPLQADGTTAGFRRFLRPRAAERVLAFSIDLGKVGAPAVSRYLMLAYDDDLLHRVLRTEGARLVAAKRRRCGRPAA